jgi:hypothetical protein
MVAHNLQEASPSGHAPNLLFGPATELERNEIRDQLGRILASPAFHNSKRYAAVLKYIVDQTLEGFGDRLKERTIGIEVFERPADYDTATDHAVRSAVAEVRKRLAQYYMSGARGELRIEIQPGSYLPQFRWSDESPYQTPNPTQANETRSDLGKTRAAIKRTESKSRFRRAGIIACCVILAAIIVAVFAGVRASSPLDGFWKPLLSSRAPVLLSIGNVEGGEEPPTENPGLNSKLNLGDFQNSPNTTVNEYDAFTLAKFAGLLQANGRQFRFASQSDTTFTDLQKGPAILVGLLNNNWTERLVPKLRFTVERPAPNKFVIRDRSNPSNNDWSIDYATPYLDLTKDYALVLRMVDPKTEQTVIVAAGFTVFGTSAAGDFLINKNEMKKLAALAPQGWEKKNMEIVLSTDVIRGQYGPATIVATHFW